MLNLLSFNIECGYVFELWFSVSQSYKQKKLKPQLKEVMHPCFFSSYRSRIVGTRGGALYQGVLGGHGLFVKIKRLVKSGS